MRNVWLTLACTTALLGAPSWVRAEEAAHKPTSTPPRASPAPSAPPVKASPRTRAPGTSGVRPADGSPSDEGALAEDVATLQRAWSGEAEVGRLEPRLLERGDRRPVFLPSAALNDDTESCTTVAVLGARNASFVLLFGTNEATDGRRAWPVPSSTGVAEVTRCGARKSLLEGLTVQMRSPRGLLEYLVAVAKEPPTPIVEILPRRDPGPSQSAPSVGPRPTLQPVTERARRAERRARRDGAKSTQKLPAPADRAGHGFTTLQLETGCHRIEVLGAPGSDGEVDVDAELYTLSGDEELTRDESENGQATLRYCVGRSTRVRLAFSGAASESEVVVVQSSWELPDALPVEWGPIARGRLATALGTDLLRALPSSPVYTSLGVQGATLLPFEVEPGACYAAAVGGIRGQALSVALGVDAVSVRRENHSPNAAEGVALSFCNRHGTRALLEVQASGAGLAWLLGVWQTSRAAEGDTL